MIHAHRLICTGEMRVACTYQSFFCRSEGGRYARVVRTGIYGALNTGMTKNHSVLICMFDNGEAQTFPHLLYDLLKFIVLRCSLRIWGAISLCC